MKIGKLQCSTINTFPYNYQHTGRWKESGVDSGDFSGLWTDGTNIYFSDGSYQLVLVGDEWEHKTWNGLTSFNGKDVWTDGTNIYYSYEHGGSFSSNKHYVLNGDTWERKYWGFTNDDSQPLGRLIWSDGTDFYYYRDTALGGVANCVLSGSSWVNKTWNGDAYLDADDIWSDGTNIYISRGGEDKQYVLNGDTWEPKTWTDRKSVV